MFDAPAREVEIGLRRRRKTDLDFLEAHVEQQVEHPRLALVAHRVDQRLVAVAQVDRAPDRRLVDAFGGPGAVGETDQRIGLIFAGSVWHAAGGADIASFVHRRVLRRTGRTIGPWRGDATIRSSCGDCDWRGASASNRPPGAPSAGPAIADKAEKQQRRSKRAHGRAGQDGGARFRGLRTHLHGRLDTGAPMPRQPRGRNHTAEAGLRRAGHDYDHTVVRVLQISINLDTRMHG